MKVRFAYFGAGRQSESIDRVNLDRRTDMTQTQQDAARAAQAEADRLAALVVSATTASAKALAARQADNAQALANNLATQAAIAQSKLRTLNVDPSPQPSSGPQNTQILAPPGPAVTNIGIPASSGPGAGMTVIPIAPSTPDISPGPPPAPSHDIGLQIQSSVGGSTVAAPIGVGLLVAGGAGAGFLVGGPLGALIGAGVGFAASKFGK